MLELNERAATRRSFKVMMSVGLLERLEFGLKLLLHLLSNFGVLGDDVLRLVSVGFHVVELVFGSVFFESPILDVAIFSINEIDCWWASPSVVGGL